MNTTYRDHVIRPSLTPTDDFPFVIVPPSYGRGLPDRHLPGGKTPEACRAAIDQMLANPSHTALSFFLIREQFEAESQEN